MANTPRVTEPHTPRQPSDVKRANRSILLFFLLPFPLFILSDALGINEEVAFSLIGVTVLIGLQIFLRGTVNSPRATLGNYRDINLSLVAGLTALVFLMDTGLLTFASALTPRLYEGAMAFEPIKAWELPFSILTAVIFAPFYEELVFRGLALKAYREARSPLFAVLFTSGLFAFIHGSLIHTLIIFPSAILFALVMLKTGQLWTVITVHALGNLYATFSMFIQVEGTEVSTTLTSGFLGLALAASAFWVGFRWLAPTGIEHQRARKGRVWTVSLVIVVIIAALINLLITYEALSAQPF